MEFCTVDDLRKYFGDTNLANYLDKASTAGLATNAILMEAVAAGNDYVSSYVRKQQNLPLTYIPPYLKMIACFEAFYIAGMRLSVKFNDRDADRRSQNQEYLDKVAANEISLPFVALTETNQQSPPVTFTINASAFNAGKQFGDSAFSDYRESRNG